MCGGGTGPPQISPQPKTSDMLLFPWWPAGASALYQCRAMHCPIARQRTGQWPDLSSSANVCSPRKPAHRLGGTLHLPQDHTKQAKNYHHLPARKYHQGRPNQAPGFHAICLSYAEDGPRLWRWGGVCRVFRPRRFLPKRYHRRCVLVRCCGQSIPISWNALLYPPNCARPEERVSLGPI